MYSDYSWSRQRDKCLARDNYSCQICDKKQRDGYRLCIHHIIPYNESGSHGLRNLICLCSSCHGKVHGNKYEKSKEFLQLIANIVADRTEELERKTTLKINNFLRIKNRTDLLWNKLLLFVSLFVRDQILEPMNLKKELYPEFLRKAKQCEEKDDLVALVKKTFLKAKEPSQEIAQEKILPKDVIEPLGKKIILFLERIDELERENTRKINLFVRDQTLQRNRYS